MDAPPPTPPDGFDPRSEEQVSGLVAALGARLAAWSDGFARLEVDPPALTLNRQGVLHGGLHAVLLDTAAGYAGCFCAYPGRVRRALTLSLATQFLAAARGGRLIVEGRVRESGRSVFFADAEVRTGEGRLLATAQGVFKYRADSLTAFGAARGAA